MSIHFTATIKVKCEYLDSTGNVEHESTSVETHLDLGSYRANRCILPRNKEGYISDCGSMVIDYERFINYIHDIDNALAKAALAYAEALSSCNVQDEEDFRQWVEVMLTWA